MKPAKGILLQDEYEDYKQYYVQCSCEQPQCSHSIVVEASSVGVSLTINHTLQSHWWERSRLKQIWQILTQGYVETSSCISICEKTALLYADTLKQAIQDVKDFRNDSKV